MNKSILLALSLLLISFHISAQIPDSVQAQIDSLEATMEYQTGVIQLEAGDASITVPAGFRFLGKEQSNFVLTDLFGNPADNTILGMLVPEDKGILHPDNYFFTVSYDEMGYVKDDDAESINYDELLRDQQKEIKEENPQRIKEGYDPIEFIGWASSPYYDKNKKVLHWARELRFGEDSVNTLNYNLRVLGRKGIFMLNAIATMDKLETVKTNIDKVIGSVSFKEGSRYADFNPGVDKVAAWTVGGLVAGKILAKAGFFVVLLKFWKVIALGLAAFGGGIWRFIRGRSKGSDEVV